MQAFADPCTLGNYNLLTEKSLLLSASDQLTNLPAPSLNELRLRSNDVRSVTAEPYAYIKEVEAIQEVLFVLAGSAGQLFQRLSEDKSSKSAATSPTIKCKEDFMFKVSVYSIVLDH